MPQHDPDLFCAIMALPAAIMIIVVSYAPFWLGWV